MDIEFESDCVLSSIKYTLITTIGLSFVTHLVAIWIAIDDVIDEDVYHQRNSSLLNLQIMLFSNKYTKIRSSLLLLLLIQCILPFIGLFAIIQELSSVLIIYSIIMLIVFIIELKCFPIYVKLLSLSLHYFATLLTFLLLLFNKYYLVPKW